ncbi:MAG: transposase [Bacteroidales bacterium]|nr:transposase [Bacteroidales bacterium]
MVKIQKISQFQHTFQFKSPEENFSSIYARFTKSNLGKIYCAILWNDLVNEFDLKESAKGPDCLFSPQGKLGLMFLKHYACCSDERLIEQLNANIHYQFFCDILLSTNETIDNFKIVSQIRCELAENLDIHRSQKSLSSHWLPYMKELDHATTDATCYESEVRYPTNQKLLWESVNWNYGQMKMLCKHLKIQLPRTKYLKWKDRYFAYSRKRRKPANEKRVLTRALLNLLQKLNEELDRIEQDHCFEISNKYAKRREVIRGVYSQQLELFTTGESPENRIVSIAKSYLRPIVRGKEIKKVEFGAKINKIQIDGINFIEHLSFEAFNEGTHFKSSVRLAQELTYTRLTVMGADAIYATNANRKFATTNNIRTDFCRKGRAGKHEKSRKQLASMITKERASRLEGSFGKEKEHYHLKKIKARTKKNEILWIFFGIHTANALEIGRRMALEKIKQAA